MPDTRYCSYCHRYRDVDSFTVIKTRTTGSGARRTPICQPCAEARSSPMSADLRDEFGKTITEINKTAQSTRSSIYQNKKR